MEHKFVELVDINKMNIIIERFFALTGIGATLTDLDGNVLTKMGPECGWQDICMKFHRVHPETLKRCIESDTAFAMELSRGVRYVRYRCLNGMIDVAIPIFVEGKHIVNLFSGQWMTDPPDIEFFRSQARQYGFDEDAYLEALSRVKILSENHVKKGIELLVLLTEIIAETALTQKHQAKLTTENALIRNEMELAKKIQTCLLPEKPEISGYEIAVSCDPSEEVGGDYYDVISVAGYDWIVIGDVSGHGVTAGLVMMMVQTAIHTVLNENPETEPSHLLSVINKTIYNNIELMSESKHMTIIVLAAGKDGRFSFSGLHEDILIRRAETGEVEVVESDGMWIGLEPDISKFLSDDTLKLESGDCMVLFTDGITEAICKEGKLFGDERLIRVIEESGEESASEIRENIINALEFCEKPDDVTLVVMKRKMDKD